MDKHGIDINAALEDLPGPVLIVSSLVGKGNFSIGEAIRGRDAGNKIVAHINIDELLPPSAVEEDLLRYKFISDHARFLLYLIYRIPFFYWRKMIREKFWMKTNLDKLKAAVADSGAKTVIGISHRPTFWLSALKRRGKIDYCLCGVLSEFGSSLGWKYIFWDEVDLFLSPLEKKQLPVFPFSHVSYRQVAFLSRKEFGILADYPGDPNKVLLIAGYWGQIAFEQAKNIIKQVIGSSPEIHIFVVCGTNSGLEEGLKKYFSGSPRVKVYGRVAQTASLFKECASIITKPGFSTLIEAFAARRKIFLLKGMPVAEDNNARYAVNNFAAEWFNPQRFNDWHIKAIAS